MKTVLDTPAAAARIVAVDDEKTQLDALCASLCSKGYEVIGFVHASEALAQIETDGCDLLLTDLMMPDMDGVELIRSAHEIDQHLVGVLMTGHGTIETAVKGMQAGAVDYILKPIRVATLIGVIERALAIRRLSLENVQLRNTVEIHEFSQAIARTLEPNVLIEKIADAAMEQFHGDEASVMLLSEDEQFLEIVAVRGEHRDALLGTRQRVGEGIAGQVAATREPRILEGPMGAPEQQTAPARAQIVSSLSLPMITRDRLIGVLNVNSTQRAKSFTPGHIRVLSIFTNAAAAGLEAARLHEAQRQADERYREVLDMAADAIVSIDGDHRIVVFNTGAERIFGHDAAEIIGQPIEALVPETVAAAHRKHVASYQASGAEGALAVSAGRKFVGRRKDGALFDADVSISKRHEGSNVLCTAIVRDVSERVRQEHRIARLSRLREISSHINAVITRTRSREELCRETCRIAVETGGFRLAWVGFACDGLGKVEPFAWSGDEGGYLEAVGRKLGAASTDDGAGGRALREQRPIVINDVATSNEVRYRDEALTGGFRSIALLPLIVNDAAAGVVAFYSVEPEAFDHEEIVLLEEVAGSLSLAIEAIEKADQLLYAATHNSVTRLPSTTGFIAQLDQRLRAAKTNRICFATILLDVERFSHINETLGWAAGDTLLRQLGNRLSATVGEDGLLGHLGANRFAIATWHMEDGADIARALRRILASALKDPFDIGDTALLVAARAGIVVFPTDGRDSESLLGNAEAALRTAKQNGQRTQFYESSMNAHVGETLRLENRLRGALERGEFVLHYQPKIEFATGRIVGLEALLRWQDPENGMVSPARFVPLLEETGLVLPVGQWVMTEAVRAVADLRAEGFEPTRIAVNVSPVQLRDRQFVRYVEEAISIAGPEHHGLDLEITESVIMHDIQDNVRKLDALRALGIEIAIDDFGTGYSSLAYIGRLPVNTIKIDRSFVCVLGQEAGSAPIVQTIVSLTHTLGRKVVAEGVETEAQAKLLRDLGCDQYQGFLFSKPLPLEDVRELLRTQGAADGSRAVQRA